MAMKEDELVRLMDAYMGCEGYYMKPKIEENGKSSFLQAAQRLNVLSVQMSLI